jgi:hypothetical protein
VPLPSSDLSSLEQLVVSIKSLAMQATTLAVDSVIEAARADVGGDTTVTTEHAHRLAVGAAVATAEIAWLATELDASTAGDRLIVAAGLAITGLQSSLLSIAAAVQEMGEAGGRVAILDSAEAVRTAALQLDELLPAYQPCA